MHKIVKNLIDIQNEIKIKQPNNNKLPNIIAVSKTFELANILPLIEFGHCDYGENKVQEAQDKWSNFKLDRPNLKLHMLGKLQTNKVKIAVKLFDYIHSLDNEKLAEKISKEQKKINKKLKLFIQVNIGNEEQKSGISVSNLKNFYEYCKKLDLNIIGLMCLPPNNVNPAEYFIRMINLKNELNFDELSMGMSSDYLQAVEKGSTFIRIGTKIFGQRN